MGLFGRDDRRERTAADREAARLERERRRALRGERTPAPEPELGPDQDVAEPPPLHEPVAEAPPVHEPAAEPPPLHEPVAEWPQPEPPAPEPPGPEPEPPAPEPEPAPFEPQPTQPFSPVEDTREPEPVGAGRTGGGGVAGRRTVSLPRPQTEEHRLADHYEEPIGTVRRSRQPYTPQPGAPGFGHRPPTVTKPRRRLRRIVPLALLLLLLVAIVVFAVMLFQPFHGAGKGSVAVRIPPGATAGDIGDELARAGVVKSGFLFALRARLSGDRSKLRSGSYTMRKDMSYSAALDQLTAAPAAAPVVNVTLPEGPSRSELVPLVKRAGVQGDYLAVTNGSKLLRPSDYGAPKGTKTLEGFLFPATYQLRRSDAGARTLVNDQLTAFKRNFAQVDLTRAKRKNLTRYDVLIIASMIEREAMVPKDRRLIAAVIYNRLKQGIPLGVDATIRYRLNNWSRPLRQSELNADSAYNTRKHTGLPPTPIGNPGMASIRAAANPAKVSYLYYVVKPCGNGAHAFSSTDAQFQRDVAAYNRARAKAGGKDPSRCNK